ncbi:MAG: DUF393 domain-containing protein [Myxococcales bacterium]|nr:DUF393 domain-containing protein [Myxococcales bacterium]MCB9581065.1 DUF393 domain-containing protein [Polyangiaceae bacterium]
MARFTVLYDEGCELCQRCRAFLEVEPAYVELTLLAAGSDEARLRFGTLPWLGQELVVVAEDGRVWAGAAAFLVCLWALRDYREWSYRLSGPALAPLAERFFRVLSAERRRIGALFDHRPCAADHCGVAPPSLGPYR